MQKPAHPQFSRRFALQAGGVGLLGLGMNSLADLRAMGAPADAPHKACIYVFLSGGLAQHESFDPKPDAPGAIGGEFKPIATNTPGLRICEHLPLLAQRSEMWSLIRSLTHPYNEHSNGHHVMLTGRTPMPLGFDPVKPKPTDFPSIASVVGAVTRQRTNLPPAVVLPDCIKHNSGRILPGQFGGVMGPARDPWFIEASAFDNMKYGAFPQYEFDHGDRPREAKRFKFDIPSLTLPEGLGGPQFEGRLALLKSIEQQRTELDRSAAGMVHNRSRERAVSLLTDPQVRRVLDPATADQAERDRYGDNSFGWSLIMARRLVESGVNLVQVNLGNNETWDTHGNAFPHLKNNLLPPTDRALSALLDDLAAAGRLDDTLIVMAGEFGRTPHMQPAGPAYKSPGRDHWGAVQSVWLAGGGVKGGRVIGSSDKIGGYPASDPQTPETFAATIYHSLGIPREVAWRDAVDRPHLVYEGSPIAGLF